MLSPKAIAYNLMLVDHVNGFQSEEDLRLAKERNTEYIKFTLSVLMDDIHTEDDKIKILKEALVEIDKFTETIQWKS